jgi:uncharacterized delta-60 repeat protein
MLTMLTKAMGSSRQSRLNQLRLMQFIDSSQGPTPTVSRGDAVRSSVTSNLLVSQRNTNERAFQSAQEGVSKLTTADGALELSKSFIEQARELASTANEVGADRAAIAAEVNDLLAQAKEIMQGATFGGRKLFSGSSSEIRVPTGLRGSGDFAVRLGGTRSETQTVTTTDTNQPTKAWTRLVGGRPTEGANALTTGTDGSIYMAGESNSTTLDGQTIRGSRDGFITKYNPDGTKAWTRLVGESGYDAATALTTGTDGSMYVSGTTGGSTTFDGQTNSGGIIDSFITKYNPDGTKAWTRLVGGSGRENASALTTGTDGSIYVAGSTDSTTLDGQTRSGIYSDAFITKYNPDGTKAWTRLVGGEDLDTATGLTTATDGSIYVSGYTKSTTLDGQTNSGDYDAFITKYNPDGTKAWTRLVGESGSDAATALTTGTDGSMYVIGITNSTTFDGQTTSGDYDAFITKYNPDGTKAWTRLTGGGMNDYASALTVGTDGGIYVSGTTDFTLDGQTAVTGFVTKYNSDGTKAWTELAGGSGIRLKTQLGWTSPVVADALTTGTDGSIYVSGATNSTTLDGQTNSGSSDAFITKYTFPTTTATTTTTTPEPFVSDLTVDLSTAESTMTALATIDAALVSYSGASRRLSTGLRRANAVSRYLSSVQTQLDRGGNRSR